MERILTAGPYVDETEIKYVLDAVKNGWGKNWNIYLKKFEEAFAKYVGVKYCMATSCCTGALHLSLASLGIGPGDEVIVPDMTWIGSNIAINYLGATPVFVDIKKEDWTVDPNEIEKAITKNTKAIIPVHMYGYPCDMEKIMEIAKKHNLHVIEDAAPAVGATVNGKKVGSFGTFGCFSFQGAKLLVTGEGGMLCTNDKELFDKAHNLNDHGRDPNIMFWINQIGYKYKMSNMQAAFGLAQLEKIDYLIKRKREVYEEYCKQLKDIKEIEIYGKQENKKSIFWMTSILVKDECKVNRDEIMKQLDEKYDVDSRPVFPKVSKFPMYKEVNNKVSDYVSKRAINLPSSVILTKEEITRVCDGIKGIINGTK